MSAKRLEKAIKNGDGLGVALLMASVTKSEISEALLFACSRQREHTHIVSLLMEHGADIEFVTYAGWTPLHRASRLGHVECVSLLISRGADVHAKGMKNWTALHWACYKGNIEAVKLLVAAGADIHFKNDNTETPLDVARDNGQTKVVEFLESLHTNK